MSLEDIFRVDPAGLVVYDPAEYSDYFVDRATDADYARLRAGRIPARIDPLEKGVELEWNGPNLHSDALPPTDYPCDPPEPSPHDPRPLCTSLLAANSPARGSAGWKLRLVEGVQTGADQWSQVWRCKIVDECGQDLAGTVILKLYQQSLFPLPDEWSSSPLLEDWNWFPARHLVEREAQAYSLLKPYQGRDIPLCYGFYRFQVPCGEEVVGVILEDLVEDTRSLFRLIEREDYHDRFTMDSIDALASAAFDLLYRIQNCHLLESCDDIDNILVVKGSFPANPRLIAVGFSKTASYEQIERAQGVHTRVRAVYNDPDLGVRPAGPWAWRRKDQRRLDYLLRSTITDSPVRYKDWIAMERKRGKLPYIDIPYLK
ncbi:hypothetical protein JCM10449v2_004717 [Rhodotorula kratochvilovae]